MATSHLSIFSLNARGLRNKKKRENLFFWLKERKQEYYFYKEHIGQMNYLVLWKKSGEQKSFCARKHNIVKEQLLLFISVKNFIRPF